jgi:adenosylcobinamide-GDP ribazoletransferase
MTVFRGLRSAIGFMTILPTGSLGEYRPEDLARATPFFPAAGFLVGAVVALATYVGALIDPWLAALLGLTAWVCVTGALHLDGLSDLTDATAASHRDQERFMAVLKDPHVGAFGVVAIVLQLAAKLILLRFLADAGSFAVLILIPAAARLGPLVWTRTLPPLGSGSGLARSCSGQVKGWHLVGWSMILLVSALFTAPALASAFVLIPAWSIYLKRRVGGVNGDCHGAGIELIETSLLLAVVCSIAL